MIPIAKLKEVFPFGKDVILLIHNKYLNHLDRVMLFTAIGVKVETKKWVLYKNAINLRHTKLLLRLIFLDFPLCERVKNPILRYLVQHTNLECVKYHINVIVKKMGKSYRYWRQTQDEYENCQIYNIAFNLQETAVKYGKIDIFDWAYSRLTSQSVQKLSLPKWEIISEYILKSEDPSKGLHILEMHRNLDPSFIVNYYLKCVGFNFKIGDFIYKNFDYYIDIEYLSYYHYLDRVPKRAICYEFLAGAAKHANLHHDLLTAACLHNNDILFDICIDSGLVMTESDYNYARGSKNIKAINNWFDTKFGLPNIYTMGVSSLDEL